MKATVVPYIHRLHEIWKSNWQIFSCTLLFKQAYWCDQKWQGWFLRILVFSSIFRFFQLFFPVNNLWCSVTFSSVLCIMAYQSLFLSTTHRERENVMGERNLFKVGCGTTVYTTLCKRKIKYKRWPESEDCFSAYCMWRIYTMWRLFWFGPYVLALASFSYCAGIRPDLVGGCEVGLCVPLHTFCFHLLCFW